MRHFWDGYDTILAKIALPAMTGKATTYETIPSMGFATSMESIAMLEMSLQASWPINQ